MTAPAGAALAGAPAFPAGPAYPSAQGPPGQVALTAQDLHAPAAAAAGLAAASVAAPPPAAWPNTRPIAARAQDDFADLLPPVRYDQPCGPGVVRLADPGNDVALASGGPNSALAAQARHGAGLAGYAVPAGPGRRSGNADSPAAAGPGRSGVLATGNGPALARRLLVIATIAVLVAVSVLLPLAGAIVALAVLVLLRATDVTTGWLARRRSSRGPRRSDPAAVAAFYPWAVCRSVLRFLLISPLALLCGAGAAVLAVLAAGSASLPRAGGYAVGAFVACYCLGPGSGACRRPLSRFYGAITRTASAAVLGTIGIVAVAAAVVAAAATHAPGYWPDAHLGNQLQTTTILHPGLSHLSGNLTEIGRKLARLFGQHG